MVTSRNIKPLLIC